jgi:hypothetical protein
VAWLKARPEPMPASLVAQLDGVLEVPFAQGIEPVFRGLTGLKKSPPRRYLCAEALRDDLAPVPRRRSDHGQTGPPWDRFLRWMHRQSMVAGAIAGTCLSFTLVDLIVISPDVLLDGLGDPLIGQSVGGRV